MKQLFLTATATLMLCVAGAQVRNSENIDAFFKRNPDANTLHWEDNGNKLIVKLKSGKQETYDLRVESERNAALAKYGQLPPAAHPPALPAKEPAPPTVTPPVVTAPPPPLPVADETLLVAPPPPPPTHPLHHAKPSAVKDVPPPPPPKEKKGKDTD